MAQILPEPKRGVKAEGVGKCAEALVCSAAWVRKLYRVGKTFGSELRYPDVPFSLYVVALRFDDPQEALETAIAHDYSVADLLRDRSGKPDERPVCETCGRPLRRASQHE